MPNEIELYSLLNLKRDKKPDMIVIGFKNVPILLLHMVKKAGSNANNSSAVKTGLSLTSKASIAKIQNRKNRSNSFGVEDHFLILTDQCLGEEYVVLEKVKLLEMRQLIYVRREIYPNFSIDRRKKVEATGLAHVVGNKGGLAIS